MCKYYWAFVWLSTEATSLGLGARGVAIESRAGDRELKMEAWGLRLELWALRLGASGAIEYKEVKVEEMEGTLF